MKEKIECRICHKKSYYELDDYEPMESFFRSTNPLLKKHLLYMIPCSSCGQLMEHKHYVEK